MVNLVKEQLTGQYRKEKQEFWALSKMNKPMEEQLKALIRLQKSVDPKNEDTNFESANSKDFENLLNSIRKDNEPLNNVFKNWISKELEGLLLEANFTKKREQPEMLFMANSVFDKDQEIIPAEIDQKKLISQKDLLTKKLKEEKRRRTYESRFTKPRV